MRPATPSTGTLVLFSVTLSCGIFVGNPSVRAATSTESFDYASGSNLIGQSGGTGWAGAWTTVTTSTTNSAIGAGSLTYPGITSVGNKMISVATGNGDSRALRSLDTGYSSGTLYCSVLVQNLNDSLRYLGLSLYSSGTEMVLLGQGTGFSNWTLNRVLTNGISTTLDSGIDSSALALLVLKIDFNASSVNSAYENVTFWVNPDLAQPESVTNAVGGQTYSTDRDYVTINRVRIGGAATSGELVAPLLYTDEVRISTLSPFAPPTLQLALSEGDAFLSWPATGWTLQKASALNADTWTDVTGSETLTLTNLPVSLPVEFFRLRQE